MGELLVILSFILLTDMVNPVLFAGVVYGLGSSHPIRNTLVLLLSHFTTYFLAGVLIAEGLEFLIYWQHLPQGADYVLEFFVAILLLYIAYRQYRAGEQHPEEKLKKDPLMTVREAWWVGVHICLIGLPIAVPYLAAIDQILKANLSYTTILLVLLLYNVLYILPFAAMIGLRWIYHKETNALLQKINRGFQHLADRYIPILFLILALLLLEDCISFFLGYREYSFLSLSERVKK